MSKNDEELKGSNCITKGAYRKQGASRDGEFVLQYLKSMLTK